ncbi:MAG: hypothetical protein QM699_09745 [Amaricoccus sp.]|uniref:hypothetical protein n=1 Tax=Amaricoccus sp. TaxID=1872485 RepID=UPI0039E6BB02
MFPAYSQIQAATAWMDFSFAYGQMCVASAEIIARRCMRMAQGSMTGPEAVGMVLEKATAFATATERAAVAAATGADPVRIASAALRPYSAKTRSNVRRLRR